MSKIKPRPKGIELITQKEIAKLCNVSVSKISYISRTQYENFPKPVFLLAHREFAYDFSEIQNWLNRHNPSKIKTPYRQDDMLRKREKAIARSMDDFNTRAVRFITCKIGKQLKPSI
jgi:predicted DNA-binding transcriptional regulator AlpA